MLGRFFRAKSKTKVWCAVYLSILQSTYSQFNKHALILSEADNSIIYIQSQLCFHSENSDSNTMKCWHACWHDQKTVCFIWLLIKYLGVWIPKKKSSKICQQTTMHRELILFLNIAIWTIDKILEKWTTYSSSMVFKHFLPDEHQKASQNLTAQLYSCLCFMGCDL